MRHTGLNLSSEINTATLLYVEFSQIQFPVQVGRALSHNDGLLIVGLLLCMSKSKASQQWRTMKTEQCIYKGIIM